MISKALYINNSTIIIQHGMQIQAYSSIIQFSDIMESGLIVCGNKSVFIISRFEGHRTCNS